MKRNLAFAVLFLTIIYAGSFFSDHVSAQKEGFEGGKVIAGPQTSAPQTLPFTQNWSNTGMIATNDDWSGVPGIEGFLGQGLTQATGVDPQTVLGTSVEANDLDVAANLATPNSVISGGVAEFDALADPVVGFQGSGTADAPHLIFYVNTTGFSNINVAYDLRDVDGSSDNSIQPVALQYRVGSTGDFTNVPGGFVADASSGPDLATMVTPVSAALGANADNQSQVQIRVITTNAASNDEWIGVDNINITGTPDASEPTSVFRVFTARMNGASENPPNNSTATGFGRVSLNAAGDQITVSAYYANLSSGTTVGHIHGPAPVGQNASPIFDLMPPPGQTSGSVTNMTFNVTPQQVADLRAGLWYFNIHTTNFPNGEIRGQVLPPAASSDFNGDSKTDYAIVREGEGGASGSFDWWVKFLYSVESFGFNADFILPADYDGDGSDDVAVWRSSGTAGFWVLRSSDLTTTFAAFGQEGDQPNVVADYTGDGKDDYAIYRPASTETGSSEFWFIASSGIFAGSQVTLDWGLQSDTPMVGDYDGNGLADWTVIRPKGTTAATVYTLTNKADGTIGETLIRDFGLFSDFFVPGDYDGDGITDLAISRPVGSSYRWIYRPSSGGADVWITWGRPSSDFEAPGDFDGDGITDIGVWRQSDTPGASTFIIKPSSGAPAIFEPWGQARDVLTFWEIVQ